MPKVVDTLPRVIVVVGNQQWHCSVLLETEGEHSGFYTGTAICGDELATTSVPRPRMGDALYGAIYQVLRLSKVVSSPAEDVRQSLEYAQQAGVPQTNR